MKKWQKYEALTSKVLSGLMPQHTVVLNDKIYGAKSEKNRQIDVLVKNVVDCKDYKIPVDVKDVEAMIGLFDDVDCKGAIFSASGFSAAALKRGSKAGLKLCKVIDSGEHEWRTKVSFPSLFIFYTLTAIAPLIDGTGNANFTLPANDGDIINLNVYDVNDEVMGTIENLVNKTWQNKDCQFEEGQHTLQVSNAPLKIKVNNKEFFIKLKALIEVEKEMYFHMLSLEDISGLHDEIDKKIITNGFTTAALSINTIRSEFAKIASLSDIPKKPFLTFEFSEY